MPLFMTALTEEITLALAGTGFPASEEPARSDRSVRRVTIRGS